MKARGGIRGRASRHHLLRRRCPGELPGCLPARHAGSTVLLASAAIGSYHLASLIGRVLASRVLGRWQERVTISTAELLAAGGLAVAISAPFPGLAIGGLLLVGLAVAPIVPSALSLAGRSVAGRSAQAVAATTAAADSAFVISPVLVGTIADRTSLRAGLALCSSPPPWPAPRSP